MKDPVVILSGLGAVAIAGGVALFSPAAALVVVGLFLIAAARGYAVTRKPNG